MGLIPVALLLRASPYLIIGVPLLWGAWHVYGMHVDNARKDIAIKHLSTRAAELHGAFEHERKARALADTTNKRLAQRMLVIGHRQAARTRLRTKASAPTREWRQRDAPRELLERVREERRDAAAAATAGPARTGDDDDALSAPIRAAGQQ